MAHDALSKDQTLQLRAILCLIVVFGHSSESMLYEFGPAAVSVFFFLSGFALATTTWNKKLTPKYILTKFLNLLIPAFMVEILYRILYCFYDTVNHYNTLKGTINGLLHFEPAVFAGWYIEVLVILFAFYFISLKISKSSEKRFFISYLVIYSIYLLFDIFYGKAMVAATVPHFFLLGIIFKIYRDKISSYYAKNKWLNYLMLLLPMLTLLFLWYAYPMENLTTNIAIGLFQNFFPLILFYLSLNVRFNSRILKFIAKYSLWIYLTHVGIQYIIMNVLPSNGIEIKWMVLTFFIASLLSSLLLSIPLEFIYQKLRKAIYKKLEIL